MIARVASFEGVNVEAARATMDEAEAIIGPMIQDLDGYRGELVLVTEGGKVLSMTFFDSAEQAAAAEPTFDEEMPNALGGIFSQWAGRRVSVDHYSVAAQDWKA
jgi:hypothetical protein